MRTARPLRENPEKPLKIRFSAKKPRFSGDFCVFCACRPYGVFKKTYKVQGITHISITTSETNNVATKAKKSSSKKSTKSAAPAIRPVKDTLTKSALISMIAEENGLTRAQVSGVLGTLENVMLGSVHPKGAGEFTFPGLMKVTLRKVPARKAGTLIRNPATGEMMKAEAKPASVRVKIRALSKLKTAAVA
jgi:nucleoid DNA-binding protein